MWRMLLADDEILEREAIQAMIRQSGLPIDTIEAENGRKAIELTDLYHPDIVMMDIKMPGIDGIEAIRELRARYPYIKFIIVSAYDYFNYAQEAMSLGVKYYLLKPSKKQQIIEIISEVLKEIQEEQRDRIKELELKEKINRLLPMVENEMTRSFLLEEINNYKREELVDLLNISFNNVFSMIITFHGIEIELNLYEQLKNKIKQMCQCLVSLQSNNQIVLFVLDGEQPSKNNTTIRTYGFTLARKITNYINNNLGLQCFIAIGGYYNNLDQVHLSYQQALLATRKVNSKNPIVHYQDIEVINFNSSKYPLELEKKLTESIRLLDQKRTIDIFKNYFDEIAKQTESIDEVRQLLTELFIIITRVGLELGISYNDLPTLTVFENIKTYDQLYEIAVVKIKQFYLFLEEKRKIKNIPLIEKAKTYTMNNFDKEITLEMISDHVQLSSYYVSKLFKEEYGITFKDYLTKLRVDKAKELMAKTDLSVKEICYQVGYNDPNYFSRVFKKITGQSPSEFKIG